MDKIYCQECMVKHERMAFCQKCGACLYNHSVQDIELVEKTGLPLYKCTKCGKVNFWD